MDFLQELDVILFRFFNAELANPFFDWLMPIVTNKKSWFPVWLALIAGLLWKGGKRGRWALLIAMLAVATADLGVNRALKPLFERIRPCNLLQDVHLLVKKSRGLSMPSSHAANFFALATVFSYFYRRYQIIFWFLAALVAYSRVAVGVHYPFDILAGAFAGIIFAAFWLFLYQKFNLRINDKLKSLFS